MVIKVVQKLLDRYNMTFILAGIIFWFMVTPTSDFRILSTMIIPFVSVLTLSKYKMSTGLTVSRKVLNLLIAVVIGIIFWWNECRNGRPKTLVIPVSIVGIVIGYYFLSKFSQAVSHIRIEQNKTSDIGTGKKIYFFFFALSVCVMTICTKSSPLYPFNDWEDANCFFTVGKCIMNGRVMYRDIYEQKGPIHDKRMNKKIVNNPFF